MKKGKCEKGFPKAFRDTTSEDEKGFPLYRRRNTGTFKKMVKGKDVPVDNRWIVPYPGFLFFFGKKGLWPMYLVQAPKVGGVGGKKTWFVGFYSYT